MQVKDTIIGIFLMLFSIADYSFSQVVFPERMEGCKTYGFGFESDSTDAKLNSITFIKDLKVHLGEDIVKKMRGKIQLQIIVDTDGSSCLLSVDNKTNVPTEELNLKPWIEENVSWGAPSKQVSAVVVLNFADLGIECKRAGTNKSRGWHYLMNR